MPLYAIRDSTKELYKDFFFCYLKVVTTYAHLNNAIKPQNKGVSIIKVVKSFFTEDENLKQS